MLVGLKRIAVALGLLAATGLGTAPARAQGVPAGPNQGLADAVARALRGSPALSAFRIDIETQAGQVTLAGAVANPAQRAEAIARARSVPGVAQVVDRLQVVGDPRVRPADYQQVALGGLHGGGLFHRGRGGYAADGMVEEPAAAPSAPAYDGPMPEAAASIVGGSQVNMPGYPNYAWPSYAPYPNFSAVGYPTVYPWQAWPNIGPFYPYPEPPLDWRAVTARYHDGVWNLKFRTGYTRPFIFVWPFGSLLGMDY